MGFWDVLLFNIATVLGPRWVAAAAHNGASSVSLWVLTAILFFIPYGLVINELSSRFPVEGGLYVWAKEAFGDFQSAVIESAGHGAAATGAAGVEGPADAGEGVEEDDDIGAELDLPFASLDDKIKFDREHSSIPEHREIQNGYEMYFPLGSNVKVNFDPSKYVFSFGDEVEGIQVGFDKLVYIYRLIRKDLIPRFEGFFS